MYRIKSFLLFYWRAVTKYNIQSPYLYEFVNSVLDTKKEYYAFGFIEELRKKFLASNVSVPRIDYGAGTQKVKSLEVNIRSIAQNALSKPTQCRILFNIINHYKCKNVLELGTSLGVSSAYMAAANHSGHVTTCEGNPYIADWANEFHQKLGFKNIRILKGAFLDTLPLYLKQTEKLDFAFIDGHHSEEPTLQYFKLILSKCHNDSLIVIDDIYWSPGMTSAWKSICQHPEVTLSIDLYDMGIVFLKKELSKQNISFLSYKYKPWKIGLMG